MIGNFNIHIIIWLIIFLFPAFTSFGGVGLAQKVLHFTIALLVLFLISIQGGIKLHDRLFDMTILSSLTVLYYIFCTIFFTGELVSSDFGDLIKPYIYIFYLFIPYLFPLNRLEFKKLFDLFLFFLIAQILFSLLVYLPPTYFFLDIFKGRPSYDEVIFHFYRWSGTFGFPSDFAAYLGFFVYFFFIDFVYFKDKDKGGFKKFFIFVLILIALIMTVSRGGIFSIIFMVFIFYFLTKAKVNIKLNLFLLSIFSFSFLVFTYNVDDIRSDEVFNFQYIESMFSSDKDASTNHRLKEFELGLNYTEKCFPFGCGANRLELKQYINTIESLWGYHLIKWGFLGVLLYLIFMFKIFIDLMSIKRNLNKSSFEFVYVFSAILMLISIPLIFGASSAISDRFKGLPFYYLMIGYCYMFLNKKYLR